MIGSLAGNNAERATKRRGFGIYASHIGPGGSYMRRFIFRTPWFTLRLHHIMRSDDDRHLHDHPFDFVSFLLSGGYTETVECSTCHGVKIVQPSESAHAPAEWCTDCVGTGHQSRHWPRFSIVRKRAEDLHCLKLDAPVWTFVISGPKRRAWGFQTESGWVHNELYAARWPERVTKA